MPGEVGSAVRARLRLLVVLCPLIAAATGFIAFAAQTPRFPYALDYGEGMILDEASWLAEGFNIYRPPTVPPYLVPSYPPVFMLAQAPLVKLFGPAYWYGRLISQVSAAVLALLLGMIVSRLTSSRAAGAVAALTLLAIPAFSITSQLDRVDSLALAFGAGALACTLDDSHRRGLVAAGALLLLAAFTRQTAWVPAAAAIAAHLGSRGKPKNAAILLASVVVVAATLVLLLEIETGGFWYAVIESNAPSLSIAHAEEVVLPALTPIPFLLVTLACAIGWGIRRRARWAALLAGYAAGSLPELVAATNAVSSTNYVFPLAAAVALGAGFAWSIIEERAGALRWVAVLALATQASWCAWIDRPFRLVAMPYLSTLETVIARTHGPVLADELLGLLPIAGKHVWIEPKKLADLARAGLWDETAFLEDLREQRFSLVLLRTDAGGRPDPKPWTSAMWSTILEHYAPCDEVIVDAGRRVGLYQPRGSCTGAARQ